MASIMYLPYEMIAHIFGLVEDKIGLSMVCKLFGKLLLKMHRYNQISNINDSYYLKHMDNLNDAFIVVNIYNIHNHNCLNLIMYKANLGLMEDNETQFCILYQNCVKNNISRPKYISKLSKETYFEVPISVSRILWVCITYKSYSILKILLEKNADIKDNFVKGLMFLHAINNDVVKDIDCLVKNDVITYETVCEQIEGLLMQENLNDIARTVSNTYTLKRYNNIAISISKKMKI